MPSQAKMYMKSIHFWDQTKKKKNNTLLAPTTVIFAINSFAHFLTITIINNER